MGKQVIIASLSDINQLNFRVKDGLIQSLIIPTRLSAGDDIVSGEINIWPLMNPTQRESIQTTYTAINNALKAYYGG